VAKEEKEERKISPALLILPLGLGLAAALGMAALAKAAPPEEPEEPEEPEPGLANLYGKVTDTETENPISGVLVTLDGLQVYTNAGGSYIFGDLDPGGYALQFSKEGYETAVY